MKSLIHAACMLLLLPMAVLAQQQGAIEIRSSSQVEVITRNAAGKREVKRTDTSRSQVVPGATVVYTNEYRNIGKDAARNVVVTNPIPAHTVYVDRSAEGSGARIEFSTDGGSSYAPPDKLAVRDAQGRSRKASAADYTHIRWTLVRPVPAGGSGTVSFKVTIR